jgi:SAM-dependent methyltransferase
MARAVPPDHDPGLFYGELADWWPLISPVEDYAGEAAEIARLLRSGSRSVNRVLELGSGGGHNAFHLRKSFDLTLSDVSEPMLAVSRQRNPELRHLHADMRRLRIGERFDAVLIHDAIEYMVTEDDLAAAIGTAAAHLHPGGFAVIVPDATSEGFEASTDWGGSDGADGRSVRFLEWSFDPDPNDTVAQTEYSFVLRSADGTVTTRHETHHTGLFPEATWRRVIERAGLRVDVVDEQTDDDRTPRRIFLGHA